MNTANQINQVIDKIAEKVGVAVNYTEDKVNYFAEKIYPVVVKQMIIQGVTDWIFVIASLFGISVILYAIIKQYKKIDNVEYSEQNMEELDKMESIYCTTLVVGIIAIGLLVCVVVKFLPDAISYTFNPEFHAMKFITEQIKNIK